MDRRRKAGLAALLVVVTAATALGVRAASLGEGEWLPTRTDDPSLVALGQSLFDALPATGDVARDPYGTACGVPDTDYCVSSPTLGRDALVAATGAALVARGARLEHRDCPKLNPESFFNLCREVYSYRGVQVAIAADEDAVIDRGVLPYLRDRAHQQGPR